MASRRASGEPKASMWATPTFVTTPMDGLATSHRARMCPVPRAPISHTIASVDSSAASRVNGSPISLLNEARLATTW